ncbi:hypothetical protein SERLA73DRAFT_73891 [Serpula lacrymans var. lacrymans S7.3]|uniref:Uncharacterized protein n=1 Tax=Serpula lacrymans var. lacrymans (strain S7.3) TaxID=936435 RepID=F8PX82_SERL3|nr:hypothetical protein SERLA73DRAFT_73891 [Serpula lacrymans var. lacrymans S7.3]
MKLPASVQKAMPRIMGYGPWISMILAVMVLAIISAKITTAYVAANFSSKVNIDVLWAGDTDNSLKGVALLANIYAIDTTAQTMSIHWSIIGACGASYTFGGNDSCVQNGLSVPLSLYLNTVPTSSWNTTTPAGQYDPTSITNPPPTSYIPGRTSLPTSEFDTDLPLDPFLPYIQDKKSSTLYYPFDLFNTYVSLLAINTNDNSTIPIANARGYGTVVNWVGRANFLAISLPGQEDLLYSLTLSLDRQLPVKAFVVIILITNWMMSLTVLWMTIIVLFRQKIDSGLLLGSTTILFALPQIRASMPDAPPFGAFIDIGGYFMNVCLVSVCVRHMIPNFVIEANCLPDIAAPRLDISTPPHSTTLPLQTPSPTYVTVSAAKENGFTGGVSAVTDNNEVISHPAFNNGLVRAKEILSST